MVAAKFVFYRQLLGQPCITSSKRTVTRRDESKILGGENPKIESRDSRVKIFVLISPSASGFYQSEAVQASFVEELELKTLWENLC